MQTVYTNRQDTGGVAEIEGKFYPYEENKENGQIYWCRKFAGYTEWGMKYISQPYETLEKAKRALRRKLGRQMLSVADAVKLGVYN